MSANTEAVFVEALSLPVKERASLVEKLLLSFETEAGSAEIESAWKNEVIDRCQAFDEGKLTERDAADVLKDARRRAK
jgi:putative addiction module component (TIGR02574 family)